MDDPSGYDANVLNFVFDKKNSTHYFMILYFKVYLYFRIMTENVSSNNEKVAIKSAYCT